MELSILRLSSYVYAWNFKTIWIDLSVNEWWLWRFNSILANNTISLVQLPLNGNIFWSRKRVRWYHLPSSQLIFNCWNIRFYNVAIIETQRMFFNIQNHWDKALSFLINTDIGYIMYGHSKDDPSCIIDIRENLVTLILKKYLP